MELSIQKWGNSAAVRLPAALLEQVHLALGDKLVVEIRPEGIMLAPARPKYSLDQLIAQCDTKAPLPEDLADWSNIKPAGREAW
ncbi:AbrB/MazE/SpoVT family DNA-binding domain-containing protein [Caballeronia sp. LZ034LL]|uniref:AbrB/MazE/SpoVT family DNA-binding domain-containing protein n=1 Tax=Caballeronia sp. LZ034LL TaxID=3038567 RepID=UPI00285C2257|nr:AbrB/MazE/SpoVT family DNA-binding domain-containing protein [Caballeronia sp. LZ034LL]MDR5839144.1 AbrB/MazE/SpoVT family DNA-binding domain-containing protein [Caballeronia sp. LZ034LL]